MTELGPTFIKLGQMLSTRADMIGPAMAQELSSLQSGTPADPSDAVRKIIEVELQQPISEMFDDFNEVPLASASIGQVHQAKLKDGRLVVVKVQHVGIEDKIRDDLEILVAAAELVEEHLPDMRNYRPRATTAEFQRTLRRELDFAREERNLAHFIQNFKVNTSVRFPAPVAEFSTSRVLTMEFLEGTQLSKTDALRDQGVDLCDIAKRGAQVFLTMIFEHGFYHADPHPGNILVLKDQTIGLLDCGMVGRIDDRTREQIEEMLLAIAGRDAQRLTSLIVRIGSVPPQLDQVSLDYDVQEFVGYYADQPLNQFDLGGALTEMTEIIRRYQILLPAGIGMLLKVLIMLEGTSRQLNPAFNLTELITPYQRTLIRRRFSPKRLWRRMMRLVTEWEQLGDILPRSLSDILVQVQTGRFEIHLQHRSLEPSINRLVFGMLTSSLFVGSSLMMSAKVDPTIADISVLGISGLIVSMVLGLRLIRAINKSGHLDERK